MALDEISLHAKRGAKLSRKQLEGAVRAALAKGWTEIYVYDAKGKPDMNTAALINSVIAEMKVGGRVSCCMDISDMPASYAAAQKYETRARVLPKAPAGPGV